MRRLIASEVRKLRSIRLAYILAGLSVVVTILPVVWLLIDGNSGAVSFGDGEGQTVGMGGVAPFFALGLGLFGMAGEFAHRTAVSTFLATPRRRRVILAKAIVFAVAGAVLVVISAVVLLGVLALYATVQGVPFSVDPASALGGIAVAAAHGALFAILGLGVGAVVPNQTVAVAGTLVWFLVVEEVLSLTLGADVAEWLPGGVASTLGSNGAASARIVAALALAGYAAVLATSGAAVVERREVA